MKKVLVFVSIAVLSLQLKALAAPTFDLVTVDGLPNPELPFVQKILKGEEKMSSDIDEDLSTKHFSILERHGVQSVFAVGILGKSGQMTYDDYVPALVKAMNKSKIVMALATPRDGRLCLVMKRRKNIAFVLPAGDQSIDVNPPGVGVKWCDAPNLLFVASLRNRGQLSFFSNTGNKYVRVAAQGDRVPVIDASGKKTTLSSTTAATAVVAAELVKYSKENPRLKGIYLIHNFLRAKTKSNRRLSKKIRRGQVLLTH